MQIPERKSGRVVRPVIRLMIGLQVLLIIIAIASVAFIGRQMHEAVLKYTHSHVSAQARNTESLLTQSFGLMRLHLLSLRIPEKYESNYRFSTRNALNDLLNKLSYARSISILDESGTVINSTNFDNIGLQVDLSVYESTESNAVVGALRFGKAQFGRDLHDVFLDHKLDDKNAISSGDTGFFPVVMRLPVSYAATVLITVNSDYFINYISSFNDIEGLHTKLYLNPGYLIFSTDVTDQISSDFEGDEEDTIVSYGFSKAFPLFIVSKVAYENVLQEWRKNVSELHISTAVILLLIIVITSYMIWRVSTLLVREETLHEQTAQSASVFTHSSDGITITNADLNIISVNPAFEKITGYKLSEVAGKKPSMLQSKMHSQEFYNLMWDEINSNGVWQGEITDLHKDGHLITMVLTVNAIENTDIYREKFYVFVFEDISASLKKEQRIRRLSQAVEQNPTSIVITATDGSIEYANLEFYRSTGYSKKEVVGKNPRILSSGLTPNSRYKELWAALTSGRQWEGELINRTKDGTIYTERALISPITDLNGKVSNYLAVKYDVTYEKETERALKLSASVMANTLDGVLICDQNKKIIDINPAFYKITGYDRADVIGRSPSVLSSGLHEKEFYSAMWGELDSKGYWQGEFWNRRKDGVLYAVLSNVAAVYDDDGQVSHYINVFSDITQFKHQQRNLELLAHYDPLTKLPNRALLHDRLQIEIAQANREGTMLVVCFMDLDGFKYVNDTHGHDAGDELLVVVARRLEESIRSGDTAARLGGDEFLVLLGGIKNTDEYERAANRILEAIAKPIILDGHAVKVSGSMGITIYPTDNSESEQLIRHADHAMYQAKQAGRNCFVVYDPASDAAAQSLIAFSNDVTKSLETNQFVMYYQPKLDLKLGKVIGYEALIRWQHPDKGLIMPADFLPMVMEGGLSKEIDCWVIEETFRQVQVWQQNNSFDFGIVSVNVSASFIDEPEFIGVIQSFLAKYPNVVPSMIEIEVLESSAISSLSIAHKTLLKLRDFGFRIAIDDFGTGYSSLALLRHLPINTLKIDGSFVRNMLMYRNDLSIVESIIRLAHAFRLDLIAEGVETIAHAEMLLRLGCHVMQGRWISHPIKPNEVSVWAETFDPATICGFYGDCSDPLSEPSVVAAAMHHRIWFNRLEQLMANPEEDQSMPLELYSNECAFAAWYQWASRKPFIYTQPLFKELDERHISIHETAMIFVDAVKNNNHVKAAELLKDLYSQQDEFLNKLASIDTPGLN